MERAALVTGGSSGIGLAIARMLRDEGYGLTLVSRRAEKIEAAAAELGATAVAANVGDADECARAVEEHRSQFGRLDVLVNSAGVGIAGAIADLPAKHFDMQVGVNLRGLFLVTQAAIPLLRESHGLVVNLASIAGTLPTPGLATYGATKAAVISLTKSLNEELDGDGVRAIAICPGFVDTPMAEWSGLPGDEMIQPEDCAEVVRMCLRLSPHARIPQVVIERMGSRNGDVPLSGACGGSARAPPGAYPGGRPPRGRGPPVAACRHPGRPAPCAPSARRAARAPRPGRGRRRRRRSARRGRPQP